MCALIVEYIALLLLQQTTLRDLPVTAKNPFSTPADVEMGKKRYLGRCAGCHGPTGDGGKGTNLAVPALPRAQNDLALYRIIRYGIPDSEMPAHNMTPLEIWQMAAYVRTLGSQGSQTTGDRTRGALLVKNKGKCLACHIVNGEGGLTGPALTDIGLKRSPAYLRTKLIEPSKELSNFQIVRLSTQKGEQLTGVKLNEDTWSIQMRDNSGRLHSFWKADLADLTVEQKTLMPSYAKQLTQSEIDDIVAYLSSMGGRQ